MPADPLVTLNYAQGSHHPGGINQYVPKLTGHAYVDQKHEVEINFGVLDTLQTAGILAAATPVGATYTPANFATGIVGMDTNVPGRILARWGRGLTMVASGAGTNLVTINGRDYLNQRITKAYNLNGATPVDIPVAFKYVDSIVVAAGGSITVQAGFSNKFGLPFKVMKVSEEWNDDALVGPGTLTGPVLTDPATNATGDPRGLYAPTTTPNSAINFMARAIASPVINANGNGGLHGIRHFAA